MTQAKRIANRQHPLPNLEVSGAAQRSHREYPLGGDFQHGQIRLVIAPDHVCLIHLFIGHRHGHFLGPIHDMVVGQNIAVGADDHP